ncbi:hypothetical protein BT69DRAFT_1319653 [Atractiella rhizophila]|nr:hypothetical protein BT69DRAFT_1319653 [Atractiella rhizophila]
MAKGDGENNIWECNCTKYCGGEWRRVGKSSYNRHAPYREADQAMMGGIGQEDISARDMEEQGEMEDDFLDGSEVGPLSNNNEHNINLSHHIPSQPPSGCDGTSMPGDDPIQTILNELERVEHRRLVRDRLARPIVGEPGEEEPQDDLSENEQEKDEEDEEEGEEEEEEECDGEKENSEQIGKIMSWTSWVQISCWLMNNFVVSLVNR